MPFHTYWDDLEKSIICCEGEGHLTWDEFHPALDRIAEMMKEVDHRVDLIIVQQHGASMPRSSGMPHYRRAFTVLPSNWGLMVMVSKTTLGKSIFAIFLKAYNNLANGKLAMAEDTDQARKRIAEHRNRHRAKV
jgi:hypothetical protein